MPRICRLTSTYPRYGMAKPLVPSSATNLARGWTFWVIHSQNAELMLETCASKSIMQSPSGPQQLQGPHLIILPDRQLGWDSKMNDWNGFLWACLLGCLHAGWQSSGVRVGMWGAYCWLGWLSLVGGEPHFPQLPPGWFKADAGVGHSQAMWPHPWHLKHRREWVLTIGHALPPCTRTLDTLAIASIPRAPYPTPGG